MKAKVIKKSEIVNSLKSVKRLQKFFSELAYDAKLLKKIMYKGECWIVVAIFQEDEPNSGIIDTHPKYYYGRYLGNNKFDIIEGVYGKKDLKVIMNLKSIAKEQNEW